jgi:hypothetical protein
MKRVHEQGMGVIEVTEVWCINRCTGQNSWWKRAKSLSWVFDKGSSGITISTDEEVGSITSNFQNFIRAAPTVSKFSDSTGLSIAGNLDMGCDDEIANGEGDDRAKCICSFMVDSMTFFNEKAEDSFGELGGRRRETKEGMNVGSLVRGWGIGAGLRLRSKGKWKGRPTAGTLRIITIPPMGLLFQA